MSDTVPVLRAAFTSPAFFPIAVAVGFTATALIALLNNDITPIIEAGRGRP